MRFTYIDQCKNLIKNNLFYFISTVVFLLFIALVIRYQIYLLNFRAWEDESDSIVIVKMIASGKYLYSEIFSIHGFFHLLPGILLEKINHFGIHAHRIFILIIQLLALSSIYFSPLLKNRYVSKIYVFFAATFILLCLPKFYSYTYTYQTVAAFLLLIILAQYVLPSISCPERLKTKQIFIGNFLIACLPFIAISYLPIALLFSVGAYRKRYFKTITISLLTGLVLNILFLILIGSYIGFYVFHIYMNISIMPLYSSQEWPTTFIQVITNTLIFSTKNLSGFITSFIILIFSINYFFKEKLFLWTSLLGWRVAIVYVGILSLLMRGADFHGLPYYTSLITVPLLLLKNKTYQGFILDRKKITLILSIVLIIFIKLSIVIPSDLIKFKSQSLQKDSEFSKLVHLVTNKNDKIVAYSFRNLEYINSERLPVSGYFTYLPMQDKYNENPKFGIKIDGCKDIEIYKPKIMLVDKLNMWGRFPWESYGTCVQRILDKDYIKVRDRDYYLRKDIYRQYRSVIPTLLS